MVSTQQKSNTGLDSSVNSIEASSKILDKITELLELALTYHQAGQLEEAEHLYQTILDVDPAQPKANHNLGILALNAGKHDAAIQYLKTALEADPIQHQFWVSYIDALIKANCNEVARNVLMQGLESGLQGDDVNFLVDQLNPTQTKKTPPIKKTNLMIQRADAMRLAGKLKDAKALYERLLKSYPNHPLVLFGLGSSLLQLGDTQAGVAWLERSLALEPHQPQVLSNLGIGYMRLGDYQQAIAVCERAIALDEQYTDAYVNMGNVFLALTQYEAAISAYKKAISINPQCSDVYFNLGNTYHVIGKHQEAAASYLCALDQDNHDAEAHYRCGSCFLELKLFDDALRHLDRAIALNLVDANAYNDRGLAKLELGDYTGALEDLELSRNLDSASANVHMNLGVVYAKLSRYQEALGANNVLIQLDPNSAKAYQNRADILLGLNRLDEALDNIEIAISLNPDLSTIYWNKSIIKLLSGDYSEGWELYEWRWKTILKDHYRQFDQPLWLGEAIAGKTILIHAEQGFGDFIQFCRYVPLLESYQANVVLEAPAPLMPLISTLKGNYRLIAKGQPLPSFDVHCPIMSLPRAFKTTLENIPVQSPYLFADPNKVKIWQNKLGAKTNPRVGLVWSGSTTHKNDHRRSVNLEMLQSLFSVPVEFHVLQKEIRESDLEMLSMLKLHTHQADLTDFAETAALIEHMDMVATVDTSVAHVAAAMGKECWVLLPYSPDFRWLLGRSDNPWYPAVRLFRQPKPLDWATAIKQLTKELQLKFG